MPGQVVKVHAGADKRQFVDVRPSLKRAVPVDDDDEQGTTTVAAPFIEEDLPIIPSVPVGYPQGGGFFISVPLQPGDFVLLVFCERSIDRWVETASKGNQRAVSPGDVGTHVLEGAIALPFGPAPRAELLDNISATDLVLAHKSGPGVRVKPDGTICLGVEAPAHKAAIDNLVEAELDRVKNDLASLKSAINTALSGINVVAGGAFSGSVVAGPFSSTFNPSSPGHVGSAKVKLE